MINDLSLENPGQQLPKSLGVSMPCGGMTVTDEFTENFRFDATKKQQDPRLMNPTFRIQKNKEQGVRPMRQSNTINNNVNIVSIGGDNILETNNSPTSVPNQGKIRDTSFGMGNMRIDDPNYGKRIFNQDRGSGFAQKNRGQPPRHSSVKTGYEKNLGQQEVASGNHIVNMYATGKPGSFKNPNAHNGTQGQNNWNRNARKSFEKNTLLSYDN
jgi:hypothetical protein